MSNPINAIALTRPAKAIAVTGNIQLSSGVANYTMTAASGMNVDQLLGGAEDGRIVEFTSATGSSNVTFRDNQSGSNLIVVGLTVVVGALDSIRFKYSSSESKWMQIGHTNIS